MNIVVFTHPEFLPSQSMPRFAAMIVDGMRAKGHQVEIWTAAPVFYEIRPLQKFKKWLGYVDQYLIFPGDVRKKLRACSKDTLFVFTDHALGPWVPLVKDRPHVIHCHDFLAQRSAKGEIIENLTSFTGRRYQQFIHAGYAAGKNFISVSHKTKADLEEFLTIKPLRSEVVYNGLNPLFKPFPPAEARKILSRQFHISLMDGYILHVGGNQWYKNRTGVIEIYNEWRVMYPAHLPLIMIGPKPTASLLAKHEGSPYKKDIHFLSGIADDAVAQAYSGASAFLFPSLAEGFGWPIAEAMASGTQVVTTNEDPMLEVAGAAGFRIERKPAAAADQAYWARRAAVVLQEAIGLEEPEKNRSIERGFANVQRFNLEDALDRIEQIYKAVLTDDLKAT
ncbi:glycosyltransferase [Pedobacter metabolipauper]|uniref:Glycosyltransferase involved in cell wall biosynthesis n=1 Tax=Pedobacter metabolipauper TaxID=425513 RepID=A0A4R6SZ66_9SPHI|nr:glycosyltransferase [Pedobacter metabolipauper]TDQ09994.1 glycosyltransferase involved in cell wall biosynthesis [Pedobacter metabolipauper]